MTPSKPAGKNDTHSCLGNNPIPDGWGICRLNEVFDRVKRKVQDLGLPILSISAKVGFLTQEERYSRFMAGESLKNYTELRKGEFAYNKGNSKTYPCGCIYPLKGYEKAAVPHVYYCFRSSQEIDQDFFAQYFSSGALNNQLAGINNVSLRHNGLLNISASEFFAISIPVPPRPEQKKIAAILGSVDEAIAATQAVIDQTRKVKQGLLAQLLTRGIGHTRFKKTEIGEIPEEWEVVPFGKLVTETLLGTTVRGLGSGSPFSLLKMGNLNWGGFDLSEVEEVGSENLESLDSLLLRDGDFLFNTRNSPALVGKSAVWHGQIDQVVFDNNILRIRFLDKALSDFVCYQLTTGNGKRRIRSLVAGSTSVAAIYWKDLQRLKVSVPPIQEQEAVCRIVNGCDSTIVRGREALQRLSEAKRGLMQDLLTGRVRVKGVA